MQHKEYGNNFLSGRSSTKVIHAPGGGSSVGSLLFGGDSDKDSSTSNQAPSQQNNKENVADNIEIAYTEVTEQKSSSSDACDQSKSDAEKVRQFTFEAGQPAPEVPQVMNADEVQFISKMILDELLELYATVLPPQAAKEQLKKMIDSAKNIPKMSAAPNQMHEVIAEQADAFVDIWYYSLNATAKKGVNCSKIFDVVHQANMAKRDPKTGKFIKRDDGKIIKPAGWKAPNINAEIQKQIKNGAWD